MKIYTKTGDLGETSLYGGERRSKANAKVRAYGEVDELQATLGLVVAHASDPLYKDIVSDLNQIQQDCFTLCAMLARTRKYKESDPSLTEDVIKQLEEAIDRYQEKLPELRAFILQGGSIPGAFLHQARAVCRRAERATVEAAHEEEVEEICVQYLNRLSDLLFVLARTANHRLGVAETEWHPKAD